MRQCGDPPRTPLCLGEGEARQDVDRGGGQRRVAAFGDHLDAKPAVRRHFAHVKVYRSRRRQAVMHPARQDLQYQTRSGLVERAQSSSPRLSSRSGADVAGRRVTRTSLTYGSVTSIVNVTTCYGARGRRGVFVLQH